MYNKIFDNMKFVRIVQAAQRLQILDAIPFPIWSLQCRYLEEPGAH